MNKRPMVYLVAGSNGAGKTTFAKEYLPKFVGPVDFVNSDMIAHGLSPFIPEQMAIRAGRVVIERIRELSQAKKTFAFETTLSGLSYATVLRNMKKSGYHIHMYYLWIPNYELALARIRTRVLEGGHDVHESAVKRRFGRTLWNLFHVYLPFLDYLAIFDNSSSKPEIIFEKRSQTCNYININLFENIKKEARWNEKE